QAATRAHLARQAKVNAESRLLLADSKHPVGQLHYQAANNDHAHAEADLVEALADAQRAAEQKSAAQDDLKTAQKHGSHAIDDACEAERQASAAIQAASQNLAPSVCRPMPP